VWMDPTCRQVSIWAGLGQAHNWCLALDHRRVRRRGRGRHGGRRYAASIVRARAARVTIERAGGRRPPEMLFVSIAFEFIDLDKSILPL
jgi:hypothetical protein